MFLGRWTPESVGDHASGTNHVLPTCAAPDMTCCPAFGVAGLRGSGFLGSRIRVRSWLPALDDAGSVFLGLWTPESVSDYASGTNHVLPT